MLFIIIHHLHIPRDPASHPLLSFFDFSFAHPPKLLHHGHLPLMLSGYRRELGRSEHAPHGGDGARVLRECAHGLPRCNVPDDNGTIVGGGEEERGR